MLLQVHYQKLYKHPCLQSRPRTQSLLQVLHAGHQSQ
jgi:hypothetical protein